MEKPFGTFKNNIVSEEQKDALSLSYSLPLHPKMTTVLERFQKIRFCYLTPSSPLHPKMTLTISLWNIIKPHPFWNNNLSEPFRIILFWKDALSLPYSPPPTAPQNNPRYLINRTSEHFGKIRFLYLTPSSLHPKNDSLSHISNIIKPQPTWNNLSEPLRIILFRNISERYTFATLLSYYLTSLCTPKMVMFWDISKRYAFVTLLPPPHPQNDTRFLIMEHHKTHPSGIRTFRNLSE